MVVIRLGERRPLAPARRVELGLPGLVALQDALARVGAPRLPSDFEVDPAVRSLAGPEVDRIVEQAGEALRAHGVLDDDGPVDAVVANLAALTGSPYRVRTSLAGAGESRVAHYWTGPQVGGSLTREARGCVLTLFDARQLGAEILDLLPEPEHERVGREPFEAPLGALATVAALDDLPAEQDHAMGSLLGIDGDLAHALRAWSERVLAVLHVTVFDVDPARLPGMLVGFLDREGWWSARTRTDIAGTRLMCVEPCRREDFGAEIGVLTGQGWR